MPTRKPRISITLSEQELTDLEQLYTLLQRQGKISWRTTLNAWVAQLALAKAAEMKAQRRLTP